jgi:hypothetical protein
MKAIADFIIAFFDLLEAEGRTLRRVVMRIGFSFVLLLVAALLFLAAAGFFLAGIYQYLTSQFTSPAAALLISLLSLLLALIFAGIAHWRAR